MRSFKFVNDPKAFELMADETRRRIIYLLRAKEMTVSQLAGELGVTTQAVYHQISKLKEAGLVEIAREERVDHFIETYYRATAEVFEFKHGEAGSKEEGMHFKEAFDALSRIGFKATADEDVVKKILELEVEHEKMGLSPELEDKITQLEDVGFFTKAKIYEIVRLALMSDRQFEKMIENEKALRRLISSSVSKSAEER